MNTEEITETTQETVENVNLFIRFIEDHIPDMIGLWGNISYELSAG